MDSAKLDNLLKVDQSEDTQESLIESLITLIQQANRQAIDWDMAKAWEQVKEAQAIGDDQAIEKAADRYEELLLERANSSVVRTRVGELVLEEITARALDNVRQHIFQTGKAHLLTEIEADIRMQVHLMLKRIYELSRPDQ